MLGRHNYIVQTHRFVIYIFHGHLGLAIRPQIFKHAFMAHFGQTMSQFVREQNRQRH